MTIEETFASLEDTIAVLENKETTLEDAFKEYEKGIRLINEANNSLNDVKKKIQILQDENTFECVEKNPVLPATKLCEYAWQ